MRFGWWCSRKEGSRAQKQLEMKGRRTDKQTDKQTNRQTDKQTNRQTKQMDGHTDGPSCIDPSQIIENVLVHDSLS